MRRLAPFCLLLGYLLCGCGQNAAAPAGAFPPFYPEAQPFRSAIGLTQSTPLPYRITGLTVPHHLLAADLIAGAFALASGQDYRRIIILSPDHFQRSRTPFAVAIRNFQTVMGEVPIDAAAVDRLRENPLVSASNLFSHEHGVRALLPFVAHYFPRARVVAVALHRDSQPSQWDSLAQTLAPLLTSDTLLLQSTDFSHYLPWPQARRYDQETLRVLSVGDPEAVIGLKQPQHLDSRGAQYLQLRLQKQVYQARPAVVASRNSQEYTAQPLDSTTSYLVQVYSPENLPIHGVQRFCFAGDTFFGRYLAGKLARRTWREGLVKRVRQLTGGAPLIVNLEGVMMAECPADPGPLKLCMAARPALDILRDLNVVAVSLANNHTHDFGDPAYRTMQRLLTDAGITVLENRTVKDLGPFQLAAATDLDNRQEPVRALLTDADLRPLRGACRRTSPASPSCTGARSSPAPPVPGNRPWRPGSQRGASNSSSAAIPTGPARSPATASSAWPTPWATSSLTSAGRRFPGPSWKSCSTPRGRIFCGYTPWAISMRKIFRPARMPRLSLR